MKSAGEQLLGKGQKLLKRASQFKFPKPKPIKMLTGPRLLKGGRRTTKGR